MSIERRTIATEVRASKGDNGELFISGYASVFNTESHDLGGFREVVAPGAFTRSIKEKRDVKALFNHDANYVLGRSKNGTLTLAQDEKGLQYRCQLNSAMQSHRDLHASIERGDIDECSFAFSVGRDGQVWSERSMEGGSVQVVRTLVDVDLFDVSAVCYPAYPGTEVGARTDVVAPEVRSMLTELAAKHNVGVVVTVPPVVPEARADENESLEEQINEVQDALNKQYPGEANSGWSGAYWVIETYTDSVIACTAGTDDYVRFTYTVADDVFTFGPPVAVEKEWVPAERSAPRVAAYATAKAAAVAKRDLADGDEPDDDDEDEIEHVDGEMEECSACRKTREAKEAEEASVRAAAEAAKEADAIRSADILRRAAAAMIDLG
jgi:uncharacterized protein